MPGRGGHIRHGARKLADDLLYAGQTMQAGWRHHAVKSCQTHQGAPKLRNFRGAASRVHFADKKCQTAHHTGLGVDFKDARLPCVCAPDPDPSYAARNAVRLGSKLLRQRGDFAGALLNKTKTLVRIFKQAQLREQTVLVVLRPHIWSMAFRSAVRKNVASRLQARTMGGMKYRRFGRTELQMPVFSCGGMRFQQSWDDVAPEKVEESVQRNLEATVLRALELGINHIETARGYGSSEMQLGWILPKLPREKMIVQTKVEPCADPAQFRQTFEKSMRNLRLEYVDLLSLHGINNAQMLEWSLREGGCLEVARQFQREGRCRHVGFSTHATNDLIVKAIESDGFDYVNLHWYFVGELNAPAKDAAARRDMGVFIISPSDKGGMLYAPPSKMRELCAPLSPIAFNDLWCLARPEIHTLSLGAARPEDFEEHVRALEHYDRAAEVTKPIEERLRAELRAVWGPEWCEGWHEGLPSYVDVPGEVNLQEILRLWTYARALDLVEWGKMRYNLMGNAGHWFPGANAGRADCAAIQRALAGYRFVDRLPEVLADAHAALHAAPKKRLSEGG